MNGCEVRLIDIPSFCIEIFKNIRTDRYRERDRHRYIARWSSIRFRYAERQKDRQIDRQTDRRG